MLRHSSTLPAAVALVFLTARIEAVPPARVSTGALPRNADALRLAEEGANLPPLLKPEAFRRLSSAGQRAVLRAAGLLPAPGARPSRPPLARTLRSSTPAPGQNVRVNDPSTDVDGHTNSETSIAARGSSVMVGFNDANTVMESGYGISADGGGTFRHGSLPVIGGGQNFGNPVVAFGPDGEISYATLAAAGDGVSIIALCSSSDGAVSWGCVEASTVAANVFDTQDKPWLAVDTTSSKYRGRIYVTWTDFSQTLGGDFILFAVSTDGGASFSSPLALSPIDGTTLVQNSTISIGPAGEIYVSYNDSHSGSSGITVTKSTDGGATFSAIRTAAKLTEIAGTLPGGNGVRADTFPVTAVDTSGTYHLAYAAVSPGQTADRSDIFYVRSTDGGRRSALPFASTTTRRRRANGRPRSPSPRTRASA